MRQAGVNSTTDHTGILDVVLADFSDGGWKESFQMSPRSFK